MNNLEAGLAGMGFKLSPQDLAYLKPYEAKKKGLGGLDALTWLQLAQGAAQGAQAGGGGWGTALAGAGQAFDNQKQRREGEEDDYYQKMAMQALVAGDQKAALELMGKSKTMAPYAMQSMLPKPSEPKVVGKDGALVDSSGKPLYTNTGPEDPPWQGAVKDEQGNWIYDPDYLSGQSAMRSAGRPQTSVTVNGQDARSLSDIPVGQPVPEPLLGGAKLPDGMYAVRTNDPSGFRFDYIPSSQRDAEQQVQDRQEQGRSAGLKALARQYITLDKNTAIPSQDNTAGQNIGAMYSESPFGRIQDKIGGGIGNPENASARDAINGLTMKALMEMISMSDVSARAMDSDAEMRAWLGAIKGDTFESALTKLHVLDTSFGDRNLLDGLYANGEIDQATYAYVRQQTQSDPITRAMLTKAQEYASLDGGRAQPAARPGDDQILVNPQTGEEIWLNPQSGQWEPVR